MIAAVIQMECDDTGDASKNRQTFSRLVQEAVSDSKRLSQVGDILVLGPELALSGYSYEPHVLWEMGEPQGGPTESFLCDLAREHQCYVGVSYIEVREMTDTGGSSGHFLNTFALAGPNGTIQGRVSKATPCSVEAYFFRGPTSPCHVIECENGLHVGVLICYENFCYDPVRELQEKRIDVLFQPFSGALADNNTGAVREALQEMYQTVCPNNARLLRCPALYANKIGLFQQPCPSTIVPMKFDSNYPGGSMICDATGTILAEMDATTEGVTCAYIPSSQPKVGPISDTEIQLERYWGGYSHPAPWLKVCLLLEWLGARSYGKSAIREQMARSALEKHQ